MGTKGLAVAGLVAGLIAFSISKGDDESTLVVSDRDGSGGSASSSQGSANDGSGQNDGASENAGSGESGGSGDGESEQSASGASGESGGSGTQGDPGFPDTGGTGLQLPTTTADGASLVLSFDDGPHPTFTPQILDMLAAHDAQAVFCVVGAQARAHPELVQRIAAEGHLLCNHTFSHDLELSERTREEVETEIGSALDAIDAAVPGADVPFFRQPGQHVDPHIASVAAQRGMAPLDWTVDPRDWQSPGAAEIVDRVMSDVEPGAVVLLHDGGGDRTATVSALAPILNGLSNGGYRATQPPVN